MTTKAYDLLKQTKPRVIGKPYPNKGDARVVVNLGCSKEYEKSLEEFIKLCQEENDKDTVEKIGTTGTTESGLVFFKVVSDSNFKDKCIVDFS